MALLPACFHPVFDHPACGPDDACPDGLACGPERTCEPGPPPCGAGVVFCDGFESGDVSAWSSAVSGNAKVQGERVHNGSWALQVTTDGARSASVGTSLRRLATGSFHARAWFFVPSDFVFHKAELLTVDGPPDGVEFILDEDEIRAYDDMAATTLTTQMSVLHNQWFCIQLHVGISQSAGTVTLDLNIHQVSAASALDTLPAADGYTFLDVGIANPTNGQGPATIYIDDVVVSTQPLGCN
jgi:hypothetical protein